MGEQTTKDLVGGVSHRPALPHGGALVDRLADPDTAARWREKVASSPVLRLSARGSADLECIGTGVYSPLEGFLGKADYERVVEELRLADGTVWSLPIALPATEDLASAALEAGVAALADPHGHITAVIEVDESFRPDPLREAERVFGTTDAMHPGVKSLLAAPPARLAGRVTLLEHPAHKAFAAERLSPAQTRAAFADRGWKTIVGFQTRNPVHRAHEYLQKVALEMVDGLLLHPLVGETKDDDIPADVRMRCYQVLLESYYPRDRVLLSVYPAAMRYGGPREAIVHALSRKNYGCTHFIVGRDHAGVGSYYGTFEAQEIFDRFTREEIGIDILKFEHSFFCTACDAMATTKTCPHTPEKRVALSGSLVRQMLVEGSAPPPEFSRPEVAQILIDAYRKEKRP
ncbi:MAG: sulfate adenylyltransferase [Actinomycetota bacterium]|nr:sulfate adenylyltransferase [Actinomycetota bacterium]